jgi:hypothetical protein
MWRGDLVEDTVVCNTTSGHHICSVTRFLVSIFVPKYNAGLVARFSDYTLVGHSGKLLDKLGVSYFAASPACADSLSKLSATTSASDWPLLQRLQMHWVNVDQTFYNSSGTSLIITPA